MRFSVRVETVLLAPTQCRDFLNTLRDNLDNLHIRIRFFTPGTVGDGQTDDSQAFLDTITGTDNGALLIPAGRYKITRVLRIDKSNQRHRG